MVNPRGATLLQADYTRAFDGKTLKWNKKTRCRHL
jgi:hypothetical protein